jgi:hypothetical protein
MPKSKNRIKTDEALDFKIDPAVLKKATGRLEEMVRRVKQQKKLRKHP